MDLLKIGGCIFRFSEFCLLFCIKVSSTVYLMHFYTGCITFWRVLTKSPLWRAELALLVLAALLLVAFGVSRAYQLLQSLRDPRNASKNLRPVSYLHAFELGASVLMIVLPVVHSVRFSSKLSFFIYLITIYNIFRSLSRSLEVKSVQHGAFTRKTLFSRYRGFLR